MTFLVFHWLNTTVELVDTA